MAMKLEARLRLALMMLGECYEADLRLMARTWGSASNAKLVVRKMLASGDVTIREIRKSADDVVTSVALSKAGRLKTLDALNDGYWNAHWEDARKPFRISDVNQLTRRLNDNRIAVMMTLAGVAALPYEKPTLYRMAQACGAILPERVGSANDYYNDAMSDDECKALMTKGVYYTAAEVRDFINESGNGAEADVTYASKARGVFVSDATMYIVYMAQPGDNRIISVRAFAEQRFLESLKPILAVTNVGRPLLPLPRCAINERTNERKVIGYAHGEPYALIISDGDALVYSTANGGPRGKPVGSAVNDMKINPGSVRYINGAGPLYSRVFAVPHTPNGLSILRYITSASVEDWLNASAEVIGAIPGAVPSPASAMYPCTVDVDGDALPAIYMPAYECHELYQIAKRGKRVVIVTYRDMLNAIAHSVRCDAVYYDTDTMARIDDGDVPVYALNGEVAGVDALKSELARRGLAPSPAALKELPGAFGYENPTRFWNDVARGVIDVSEAADACTATEAGTGKRHYVHRAQISMPVSAEYSAQIRKAAKYNGLSVSAYLKKITHDQVSADAKAYDAMLAENKRNWRNER